MKAFITLAVVCLAVAALATPLELTEEQKAKAKVHFDECIKQENLSEEEVTKLRNKDLSNPTKNIKCFGTCFFDKVGTLKDGVVQEQVVLEKLSPLIGEQETKDLITKCKDIKGEDNCDTGFQIYECFMQHKGEIAV